MMRKAAAHARRTWNWDVYQAGRVTFVAVFDPESFAHPDPDDGLPWWSGGLDLDGFRPINNYCWWRPDDPANVWGPGTAAVASCRYEEDGCLYYAHFDDSDPDHCYPGIGWFGGILDKPWRIRGATGVREVRDPQEISAATALWDRLENEHGFVPFMDSWLFDSHAYGGRWYFPVEWEADERSCDLGDAVNLMDGWRRTYGAKIHVYGMHRDPADVRWPHVKKVHHGGPSEGFMRHGESVTTFLRSYNAWKAGDTDNWHPGSRTYW